MTSNRSSPPTSATADRFNVCGLAAGLAVLVVLSYTALDRRLVALLCMAATAAPILLGESRKLHAYRRTSAGLAFDASPAPPDYRRVATKLLALLLTLGLLGIVYWGIPGPSPYRFFLHVGLLASPLLIAVAIPYFAYLDRRMRNPHDGYWHVGRLLLGHWRKPDWKQLREYCLGWMIKGFFLPIMYSALVDNTTWLADYTDMAHFTSARLLYGWAFVMLYYIDVLFASVGYVLTLRLFDSQIRSSNPYAWGWVVTLMCYAPFWPWFYGHIFYYDTGQDFARWLEAMPWLAFIWGSVIVLLLGIYVWASLAFGVRFSNLTNRGILTHGPYRFTKHPAYIAKNLTWWLITVPFVWGPNAFGNSLRLAGNNLIYFLRAKAEEAHLSEDPDYVTYARWIDEHGVFRLLRRVPFIRYRPPSAGGSLLQRQLPFLRPGWWRVIT